MNDRVENPEVMLEILRAEGVQAVGSVETYACGKFGRTLDPEANKIELRGPIDRPLLRP